MHAFKQFGYTVCVTVCKWPQLTCKSTWFTFCKQYRGDPIPRPGFNDTHIDAAGVLPPSKGQHKVTLLPNHMPYSRAPCIFFRHGKAGLVHQQAKSSQFDVSGAQIGNLALQLPNKVLHDNPRSFFLCVKAAVVNQQAGRALTNAMSVMPMWATCPSSSLTASK